MRVKIIQNLLGGSLVSPAIAIVNIQWKVKKEIKLNKLHFRKESRMRAGILGPREVFLCSRGAVQEALLLV
jgi:hypothetical protein